MKLAGLFWRCGRRPLPSAVCLRLAVIGLLALGTPAVAQVEFSSAGSGLVPMRNNWQQRVLGGTGRTAHARAQSNVWGSIRSVSTAADGGAMLESGVPYDSQMGVLPDADQMAPEGWAPPGDYGPGVTCDGGPVCGGPVCSDPCGGCSAGCGPVGCVTRPWMHHIALFLGVQGFKGPVDGGINGNFGFNEGLNWSAEFGRHSLVGYQVGFRAVQSNFEGDQVLFPFLRDGSREQLFLTAGLFRRAPGSGWQGGIVYDYLHDRYYYGSVDLGQIRTELS